MSFVTDTLTKIRQRGFQGVGLDCLLFRNVPLRHPLRSQRSHYAFRDNKGQFASDPYLSHINWQELCLNIKRVFFESSNKAIMKANSYKD